MTRKLVVQEKNWRLHKPFKISRDVHEFSETVTCEISEGGLRGRGEAAGVSYDGETQRTIRADIEAVATEVESGISRQELQALLPPGGARNAVDCALWDLEAKRALLHRETAALPHVDVWPTPATFYSFWDVTAASESAWS